MGKKFMVIKPRYCCGYSGTVGRVFVAENIKPKIIIECAFCKHTKLSSLESLIGHYIDGRLSFVEESRIIWLPELNEQDELTNTKQLEKAE